MINHQKKKKRMSNNKTSTSSRTSVSHLSHSYTFKCMRLAVLVLCRPARVTLRGLCTSDDNETCRYQSTKKKKTIKNKYI